MKSFKNFITEISNFKKSELDFELRHENPRKSSSSNSRSRLLAVHYIKNTGKDPSNPEHVKHMQDTYGAHHDEKSGWHIKDYGSGDSFDKSEAAKKQFGSKNVKTWYPK